MVTMLPKPEIETVNPWGEKPGDLPDTPGKRVWTDALSVEDFLAWLEMVESAPKERQPALRTKPAPALIKAIRQVMSTPNKFGWHYQNVYANLPKGTADLMVVRSTLWYLSAQRMIEFVRCDYVRGKKVKVYALRKPTSQD